MRAERLCFASLLAAVWFAAACATVPAPEPEKAKAPAAPAAAQIPAQAQTPAHADTSALLPPLPPPPPPDPVVPILAGMEEARRALEDGDNGRALEYSLGLTSKLPGHPYPWQLLGLSYLRSGQKVLAAEAFKKCAALFSDDTISRTFLASSALESGNLNEALEHLAVLYRTSPSPGVANALAYIMIQDGRLDTAQVLLENARTQFPSDTVVLNNAAVVLDAMGHTSQALSLLRDASSAGPRILATRAMLNLKEGALDDAAKDIDASLFGAPSPEGSLLAGILLLQRGRLEEAEGAFREFVTVNPSRPDGYINLGLALRRMGRFAEAEAVYLEGLGKTGAADLHLNLGTLYELYRGDIPRALEHYRAYAGMEGASAQRVQGWIDYLSTPHPDADPSVGAAP